MLHLNRRECTYFDHYADNAYEGHVLEFFDTKAGVDIWGEYNPVNDTFELWASLRMRRDGSGKLDKSLPRKNYEITNTAERLSSYYLEICKENI